ncbi:MAG: acyl-CoA dehydrogenase [Actinobacteria bacterium]|nr:acyl-CoA dehydrogenase [Actinomycetota bacterium]
MLDAEPRDAVEIVFTALGLANATAGVLDDVLAVACGVEPRPDLAVLLPRFGAWAPAAEAIDGEKRIDGLATARGATATDLLVVADDGAAVVPLAACAVSAVEGVDPIGGWHRVRGVVTGAAPVPVGADRWEAAVAAGRRALGHQIAGNGRAVLDLARTHALDRVQFGRPIASFQAVRHRLAETLVAIEGLEATLGAAWDDGTPITSALAKAAAGRTARTVATHCQQVLAGIGFTTDHPYHLYLKRAMVLEGLFGNADAIVLDVGRHLIHTRSAPTLIEL